MIASHLCRKIDWWQNPRFPTKGFERDLALSDPAVLEDLETGERVPVTPKGRAAYRQLVDAHVTALARALGDRRIDYDCFITDRPLDDMLWRYLSNRARLARVR